jgi:hypothetical protein
VTASPPDPDAESIPRERRIAFAYGRTLVWARLLLVTESAAVTGLLLVLAGSVPAAYIAVLAGIHAVAFLVYGLSPLLTEHWLTRSRLVLRQGWYFRAVIPFSEIESLGPVERGALRVPLGIHRRLGRPTLYVTGALSGLVEVRLRGPRRFLQAFGLPATAIVFDVADRTRFLEAFGERAGLLAPVEPERADA